MNKLSQLALFTLLFLTTVFQSATVALAQPPIEAYGALPAMRALTISPDGTHFAYIRNLGQEDQFFVSKVGQPKPIYAVSLGEMNARSLYFATNDHVILSASDTRRVFGYREEFEMSGAYVYSIKAGKIRVLLNKSKGLHPAQAGLGKIVGLDPDQEVVFMPGFSESKDGSRYNLFRVSLKNGLGRVYKKGSAHTIDWFLGAKGKVVAREDYDNKRQSHKLYAIVGNERKLVYEENIATPELAFLAVNKDETALLFIQRGLLKQISLTDGKILPVKVSDEEHEVKRLVTDLNRKVLGVEYNGLLPYFDLFDEDVASLYQSIEVQFPNSRVQYVSTSQNGAAVLAKVNGNDTVGSYFLVDAEKIKELGREYLQVTNDDLGQISTIAYKARDGLRIPSLLTWPTKVTEQSQKKNLPLLVFPHGGPAANDSIGFDWWAQYFANRGYLILQPNFRGSTGFGAEHLEAGLGKWGKEMQNDVTDGVKALISAGYVDPKRVCIMGASYGGYSALAGAVFTPDLYRCVISVAGVSDINKMLSDDKRKYGRHHWVVRYWESQVGMSERDRQYLREISPIHFVENVKAPILLIHGDDDTVVPFSQSKVMHKALKKAGKPTTLIKLKGEDHWLSTSATRLDMLKEIDKFLREQNPA